jgi:uncharacterized protein YbcV (DUF1398 family)
MESDMDAQRTLIARNCLAAAHDGSMAFPEIVGTLIRSGFDGYLVDYRRNTTTYYLADGDSVVLENLTPSGAVAEAFDETGIAAQVRWAQSNQAGYSYAAFSQNVMALGCAGYLVSFPGRRVVYFGRTAEVHVELFPQ